MIYLVSNNLTFPKENWVTNISVEESINRIRDWPVIQFDTETDGLDAHVCNLISMQFGYKKYGASTQDQVVVDCKSIDPVLYKPVLEQSYLVGHNLKK